jgi:hypothetical protein
VISFRVGNHFIGTQMELDELRKLLDEPNSGEPTWTQEECVMSASYSETAEWEQMLEHQYFADGPRFHGPPGTWERLVARFEAEGRAVDLPRHFKFKKR